MQFLLTCSFCREHIWSLCEFLQDSPRSSLTFKCSALYCCHIAKVKKRANGKPHICALHHHCQTYRIFCPCGWRRIAAFSLHLYTLATGSAAFQPGYVQLTACPRTMAGGFREIWFAFAPKFRDKKFRTLGGSAVCLFSSCLSKSIRMQFNKGVMHKQPPETRSCLDYIFSFTSHSWV